MSQAGSVRKRGQTWTAYYFVRTPDGKRQQRTKGGFARKAHAQTYLTETLGKVNDGSWSEPTDKTLTVGRYLTEHWLPAARTGATKQGAPRRATTIASYEVAVMSWLIPHIGGERLVGLTPGHVEGMLTALAAHGGKGGRPLGGRSRQYAYLVLKMALEHAVRGGYVPRNVAVQVDRPGAATHEMRCWNATEARQFLASTAEDRLYALWLLALARGPRRGELAGLRWPDVDLDAGRVRIGVHTLVSVGGKAVESTAKTRAGRRTIPLDAGLVAALRAHRRRQLEERLAWQGWADTGYVFVREDGQPYHPEVLSDRFDRLAAAAGLPRIRLHDLRHSAATLMLGNGTPVKVASEMLGHSSTAITMQVYQHVIPGMAEDAGQALSAMLGIGAP